MVMNTSRRIIPQPLGRIILLASCAVQPIRVATCLQSALALMQKKVVRAVGTYNKVLRPIVLFVAVYVMNLFGAAQVSAQHAFSNQYVLVDILPRPCPRMIGSIFDDVAVNSVHAACPTPVAFLRAQPTSVALHKTKRLPLNSPALWVGLLRDRRELSASALTIHDALLVSANTNNLTLGGPVG